MLIQEFVDRTGYIPTEKEWEHVNEAYMDCEVDKDTFCRCWCKCNPSKVGTFFKACKEQERLSSVFDNVVRFVVRCKKTRDDFYHMDYTQQQAFMDDMCKRTKCKDRRELRDMIKRVMNATAVRMGWGAKTHDLFWQIEMMA